MKRIIAAILILTMILALAACGNTSQGNTEEPKQTEQSTENTQPADSNTDDTVYKWRIGTGSGGNDNNPYIWYMEHLETLVEERSNGRIDVELYPSGQLGTLVELSQGLIDGTVDTALIPTQYYTSIVNDMFILDISFLFEDDMQAISILNNNDTILEQHLEDAGIIPAAWIRLMPRITISRNEITSLDDFKGEKLWFAPSAVLQNKAELLGVVSCNFDLGELASSLQNGTVDGVWTDVTLIAAQKLYESAPNIIESPSDILLSYLAISKIWFEKLPEDLQELVLECASELAEEEYARVDEVSGVYYDIITSGGGTFSEPSEEMVSQMKEALSSEAEWLLENYDVADAYNEIVDLIAAYEG